MALGTTIAAILLDGLVGLVLLALVAVLLPARAAGSVRSLLRMTLLLALPVAMSAAVLNILFLGTDGINLVATVVARVMVMAGAVSLFYLVTRPAELVASLQAHGAPARVTFVIHNAIAMIPRLAERAFEVSAAQRARGLDTEGSAWRRARGVVALATPTVLGSVAEAEMRTLALETRGFGRPGRRTLLWVPQDSTMQRLVRWTVTASVGLLAAARVTGAELPC